MAKNTHTLEAMVNPHAEQIMRSWFTTRFAYIEDLLVQAVALQDYDHLDDLWIIEQDGYPSLDPTSGAGVASRITAGQRRVGVE